LAQQTHDEHPYKTLKHHGRVHQIVKDTDVSSFRKAVALYPTGVRGQRYGVAMGQYLLWKFVTKFPTRTRVGRLWLHAYRQTCIAQKRDIGAIGVLCTIYVDIRIRKGRRTYRGAFARRLMQVGAWYDPRKTDYRAVVRAEVRKPLDVAIEAIAGKFISAGVLPQE
jgi:hypothetical protein